ncbi:hypothetical protein VCH24_45280 [Variovorax boronicumulans]|nr:hypothetical protein VCH24_45280 [Variovorax boronicumulans]
MLLDNVRANLENIFHCPVFDGWGLNDGGATAFECEQHQGMHIDPERAYVEIVEDETTACYGPGIGRVIVTNLLDKAMPFIRYDSGDIGRIEYEKCSCGRETPRLFLRYGRITDQISVGGRIIGAPVLTVLMGKMPVRQYQIAKTKENELTFRIIKREEYTNETEKYLRKSLGERIGEVDLIFHYVDEIYPPQGAKHKFLVDELNSRT